MEKINELAVNLNETIALIKDLTEVERTKLDAALKNNILVIEECIKKEQAFILRSKGLENKREQILNAFGENDITLLEIIKNNDEKIREVLLPLHTQLTEVLKEYTDVYESAKTAIEINLHRINGEIEKLTGKPLGGNVSYSDNGEKILNNHTFRSRKA